MPPRTRVVPTNRPQTLREARRAYQKAGRTPSLTAAQIRAAERAVAADKRAAAILAKEKRARENKRKRAEQAAKQRAEQRKLVQQGRLPEESLWGSIHGSQQRLHNFFSAPQSEKIQTRRGRPSHENGVLRSNVRALSFDHAGAIPPDLGSIRSFSPTTLESENASLSPASKVIVKGEIHPEAALVNSMYRPTDQGNPHCTSEIEAQLDAPHSLTGSQFFFDLADDADLEIELNGPPSCEKSASIAVTAAGEVPPGHFPAPRCIKRGADCQAPGTPLKAMVTRQVFSDLSPSKVHMRIHKRSTSTSRHSYLPGAASHGKQGPSLGSDTASQLEVIFNSQDFVDDLLLTDEENMDPQWPTSAIEGSELAMLNKSPVSEETPGVPRLPLLQLQSRTHSDMKAASISSLPRTDCSFGQEDDFNDEPVHKLGGDVSKKALKLTTQAIGLAKTASQMTSPRMAKEQDFPNGTQSSLYELDGVEDQDLADLASVLNSTA